MGDITAYAVSTPTEYDLARYSVRHTAKQPGLDSVCLHLLPSKILASECLSTGSNPCGLLPSTSWRWFANGHA